ncbi:MAG: hypothetical protein ACYCSI_14785 [Solirubrobacteraceae bacterium]
MLALSRALVGAFAVGADPLVVVDSTAELPVPALLVATICT